MEIKQADDLLSDREQLIRVSAVFLGKPDVEKESMSLKHAFLRRQGLTPEEIEKAFELYMEKNKLDAEELEMKKEIESYQDGGGNSKKDLEKLIERAKKTGFLSLKDFSLTEIPAEVLELIDLKVLILSNNPLYRIPAEIGVFTNLKTLHLVNCEIGDDGIPEELFGLEHLEELNISMNHLNEIDGFLSRFAQIARLNVSNNDVLSIEDVLSFSPTLKSLNLANNNIGQLPESIVGLPKLRILRLKGNNLDEDLVLDVQKSGPEALKRHF